MEIIKKLDPFVLLWVYPLVIFVVSIYGGSIQALFMLLAVFTSLLAYSSGILAQIVVSDITGKSSLQTWLAIFGLPALVCAIGMGYLLVIHWWHGGQAVSNTTAVPTILSLLYLAFVGIWLHWITPVRSFIMNGGVVHSSKPFWYSVSNTQVSPFPKIVTANVLWTRDVTEVEAYADIPQVGFALIPVDKYIDPDTYQQGEWFILEDEKRKLTDEVVHIMDDAVHTKEIWTTALERFKKAGIYAYDPEVQGGEVIDLTQYDTL